MFSIDDDYIDCIAYSIMKRDGDVLPTIYDRKIIQNEAIKTYDFRASIQKAKKPLSEILLYRPMETSFHGFQWENCFWWHKSYAVSLLFKINLLKTLRTSYTSISIFILVYRINSTIAFNINIWCNTLVIQLL